MRARAMASSFADALDLGAPPRPPRPRPRPARVGPSAGPGLRVGTDRSGPGRRRPGCNRPGRGRQRARHRPRRPQCRRGRTHQHPRRRGHGPGGRAGGIGRVRGPRRLFSGRWCGTQGARRGARGAGRGVAGRFMAVLSCLDHLNAVGPPGRLFRGRLSHRGVVGAGAGPTGPAGPAGPAGAPPLRAIMPIPIPGPPPPGEKDPMTTGVGP